MVEFGYVLSGAQVQVGSEGYAAQFVLEAEQITQFTLRYRRYQAALQALGRSGQELSLVYTDNGGERLTPAWYTAGKGGA